MGPTWCKPMGNSRQNWKAPFGFAPEAKAGKLTVFLENMVTLASILIILSVSFERYYAVCYPLKMYSTETRSKAMVLMIVMWITAAVLTAPFLAIAHTNTQYHYVDKVSVDVCVTTIMLIWHKAYMIGRFVVVFVVPLCLLIFLYSRIIVKVVVHTMDSRQMTDKAKAQAQRSRQQLVMMLVGVVVLFFTCLLPFQLLALYTINNSVSLTLEAHLNLVCFCRLLVYVNSAGNPIIYSLTSTKFRRAFARVLNRFGCRLSVGLHDPNSEENGTLRRTTVTHYTSVRQDLDDGPTDSV
nr:hypothetical protein BaRGS_029416 [Batillaria attramentaria]